MLATQEVVNDEIHIHDSYCSHTCLCTVRNYLCCTVHGRKKLPATGVHMPMA